MDRHNNIGAFLVSELLEVRPETLAGCSTTDNVAVCSAITDLQNVGSLKLIYGLKTTIATSKKVTISADLYHCDTSGGTYVKYKSLDDQVIDGITTADLDTLEYDIDAEGLKRYAYVYSTSNLSNTSTDTAEYYLMAIKAGYQTEPHSTSPANY